MTFLKDLIKDEETVKRFTTDYNRYIKGNEQPRIIRFGRTFGGSLSENRKGVKNEIKL
jgi:hypothetical protein